MDLTPYLRWLVFVHVLAAFAFVLAHGVSAFVAFRVRAERDPARIAALLDLSGSALVLTYLSLLVLLVAGIVSGVVAGSFGRGWIWAAIAVLVVLAGGMYPIASVHFLRLRRAVGIRTMDLKPSDPDPVPAGPTELAEILDSRRPEAIALFGGTGFVALLWLMMFKPF